MLFTVWVSLAVLVRFAVVAVLQSLRLCPCCCGCGGGATAVGVYRCLCGVGARERRAAGERGEGGGRSPLEVWKWTRGYCASSTEYIISKHWELLFAHPPPLPTRPLRTCLLVALDNIHGGAGDKPVCARELLLDINQTLSGKPRNMLFMVYY